MFKVSPSSVAIIFACFLPSVRSTPLDCESHARRLLLDDWVIDEECKNLDYSLYLFIEEGKAHIDLIAAPAMEEPIKECSTPVVWTDVGGGKKVQGLTTGPEGLFKERDWGTKTVKDLDVLPLGTFPFADLERAGDASQAIEAGTYNVLTDNCATFILGMMQELDIPANKRVKEFVVEGLHSKDPAFINLVREHPAAEDTFGVSLEDMTDEQVLWKLVDFYVKMHYPTSDE